jgi:hypothetical protein
MKVIIIFYTKDPTPIERYNLESAEDSAIFLERIVFLTKLKAKFVVYKLGECLGDFS